MRIVDRFSLVEVMKENFECKDSFLANEKFYNRLNESEKLAVSDLSASKILSSSEKQLRYLNKRKFYGDIPQTKGVFSKSQLYAPTKSMIAILGNIYNFAKGQNVTEAKEVLNIIKFAIENIERNKSYWQAAYRDNDTKVILLYQNMTTLAVCCISILFFNTVEVDEQCIFRYRENKKRGFLSKNRAVKELDRFNDICRNKKLPEIKKFNELLDEVDEGMYSFDEALPFGSTLRNLSNNTSHLEPQPADENNISNISQVMNRANEIKNNYPGVSRALTITGGILAISGIIMAFVYMSRWAIMFFFYKKNDISQDLEYLSAAVEGNAIAHEYDGTKSGKVAEKQHKLAAKIMKLGAMLDDDFTQAEFNAGTKIAAADKKISNDVEAEINNNSATGDLFI